MVLGISAACAWWAVFSDCTCGEPLACGLRKAAKSCQSIGGMSQSQQGGKRSQSQERGQDPKGTRQRSVLAVARPPVWLSPDGSEVYGITGQVYAHLKAMANCVSHCVLSMTPGLFLLHAPPHRLWAPRPIAWEGPVGRVPAGCGLAFCRNWAGDSPRPGQTPCTPAVITSARADHAQSGVRYSLAI